MIEWLVGFDTQLFLFLNGSLANPVFDRFMPIITNDWLLRVAFLAIVINLAVFGKKQGRIAAILCVVTVACSDQVSAHILKPLVARIRPCHVIPSVHLLVDCSQGLSFPSSHAANSFGIATLISLIYRRKEWLYLSIAAIVSYSRIAVGVHYPLDVLTGTVVGLLCGWVVLRAYRLVEPRLPGKFGFKGNTTRVYKEDH
jgi:undecaprenyl-diphosphatase